MVGDALLCVSSVLFLCGQDWKLCRVCVYRGVGGSPPRMLLFPLPAGANVKTVSHNNKSSTVAGDGAVIPADGVSFLCRLFREKLAVARLQREVARSKSEGTMVK